MQVDFSALGNTSTHAKLSLEGAIPITDTCYKWTSRDARSEWLLAHMHGM